MSQFDESDVPVADAAWLADLLERLATTSRISDAPGCVTASEFQKVREFLAQDVLHRPRVTRAVEGMSGHRHPEAQAIIRPDDLLPVQVAKYVKHVLDDGEWDPEVTDLSVYLADLAETVSDERSDIYLELDAGQLKLTFGREGPADTESGEAAYTVVSFLPVKGLWLTGFRPDRGRAYVSARGSALQGRWIRMQR